MNISFKWNAGIFYTLGYRKVLWEIKHSKVKLASNSVNIWFWNQEGFILGCVRTISDNQVFIVAERSGCYVSKENFWEKLAQKEIHKIKYEGNNKDKQSWKRVNSEITELFLKSFFDYWLFLIRNQWIWFFIVLIVHLQSTLTP